MLSLFNKRSLLCNEIIAIIIIIIISGHAAIIERIEERDLKKIAVRKYVYLLKDRTLFFFKEESNFLIR